VTTNILIGVGGTGAKVVEAILHAAAAGLGPETLRVGFVDQDQSNGNVSRAMRLLKTITETRQLWRAMGAHHRIDGGGATGSDLLYTDIRPLVAGAELWTPHQGQQVTLQRIIAPAAEDRPLFDALFAKGADEQDMPLDEGYRGRPHIGSAAITAKVDQEAEFWRALIQQIRQSQGGSEVRLLFTGSVFGGTGAAGFPTLARLVRRRLERERITRNVTVGGVLMLPYFAFEAPDDPDAAAANVAKSEELLIQSRGALRYYDALFAQEHIFDELYLVGWNHVFDLGYHSPGAGSQENPPLAPELIAALGACRFFSPDHEVEEGQVANQVFISAREQDKAIGWSDLPSPNVESDAAYKKLGKMLRFSAAWKHWGPILAAPRSLFDRAVNRHPWFRAQGVHEVDYTNHAPGEEISRLTHYVDDLVRWAGSIQAYATNNTTKFDLWRVNDLTQGPPRFNTPLDLLTLKPKLEEAEFGQAFNRIVVEKPGADALPSANDLTRRLSEQTFEGNHVGMGRMVAALHAYSAVTTSNGNPRAV